MPFNPYNVNNNNLTCRCNRFEQHDVQFTPSSDTQNPDVLKHINITVIFRKCTQICALGQLCIGLVVLVLIVVEWFGVWYSQSFTDFHWISYSIILLIIAAVLSMIGAVLLYKAWNRRLSFQIA